MNIIKIDAIDSTNSYLKKLATNGTINSYTVVVAKHQTAGRGQMGTLWVSEANKNLTFSFLIKFNSFKSTSQFYLSMAVSLGVLLAVNAVVKSSFFIKWPNDILADKDKVAGILIENTLRGNFIKQSVIGIGLNVNQKNFSKSIGNVTSLKNISKTEIDKEKLLKEIINSIQFFVAYLERKEFVKLKNLYVEKLYKFNVCTPFKDAKGTVFLGKIIDISTEGELVIALENKTTRKFNLKEIKFASG